MSDLANILNTLQGLQHRVLTGGPVVRECGICGNLGVGRRPWPDIKAQLFDSWEEFSGDLDYPVPCPAGGCPEVAYDGAEDKWAGEYGEARIRLLEHCIHKVQRMLETRNAHVPS